MQTTALTRPPINSTQQLAAEDAGNTDAKSRAGTIQGYGHLLEGMTFAEVLDQPFLDRHNFYLICAFLNHGTFPTLKRDVDYLASWLVLGKQIKLLGKLLSVVPAAIEISSEQFAARLVAIMQSGHTFKGLTVLLDIGLQPEVLKEVASLLGQAFLANSSLTAIELFSEGEDFSELAPLFDVLAEVHHLTFIARARQMGSADCALIGSLLSKNKTMRALELYGFGDEGVKDHDDLSDPEGLAMIIDQLAGQMQLERLSLSRVPPHEQSLLGHFLCTSLSLTDLRIGLDGANAPKALVAGFSQTMSIENLRLELPNLENGMLPLIGGIANNKGSIKSLALITREKRLDLNETACLCDLIAGNSFLVSLAWRFSIDSNVNLVQIGAALGKNKRLESLALAAKFKPDSGHYWKKPDWVDHAIVPELIENLKNNKTLLSLELSDQRSILDMHKLKFPELQQLLQRNRAWQRFACSDAWVAGAAEGFFATLQMPVDIANVAAGYLMQSGPRADIAALALVNKASHHQARSSRRQAHAAMLDQQLSIADEFATHDSKSMLELLNGIAACMEDFSVADFSRIAERPSLASALVDMMRCSPRVYLKLIRNFCQAAGVHKMRSLMTAACMDVNSKWEWKSASLLSMLEQSFPPDQAHLMPYVEKALNYYSIASVARRLFIGYGVVARNSDEADTTELVSWCVDSIQPGLLIALQDTCICKVSIDFNRYGGAFARGMLEKIPQLKNAHTLSIKGIPDYADALALHRALAGTSILERLHIDEDHCGPEFDFIMQGLGLNRGITTLALACRTLSNPPAMCETLAVLLKANTTIELIQLVVQEGDPEHTRLALLAAMDDRLQLTLTDSEETASDSDDAAAQ